MLVRLWCTLLACVATPLGAQSLSIPEQETAHPPTAARIAAIVAAAQRDGWPPQVGPLRAAAVRAYERGNLTTAEAWLSVYGWANLWGETEAHFVPRWIAAVNAAGVGHPNMPRTYTPRDRALGFALSPGLQSWLLGERGFSQEFFTLLSEVDDLRAVFGFLESLHQASPATFKAHRNLALAIAVVFDVPPPPTWPHHQVRSETLSRTLPAATDAFGWWVRREQQGRTAGALRRHSAQELKFVIDAIAPFAELEWAREHAFPADLDLARTYSSVRYRVERVTGNKMVWPGSTYRLQEILATGGICADQAYFAEQVGKSGGVPTLLFHGPGSDGRHAWIGYLDATGRWQLDVGRYAEQRYVTGYALDPQTWGRFSDHELLFLKENFRAGLSYRQSRVHQQFAADFLTHGNASLAATAARQAVRFEPRNRDGWETLIEAERRQGADARTVEVLLREAVLAFQRHPDLEAAYVTRVVESLRARGQVSEAEETIRRIARKNQDTRVDISVQQARAIVLRAVRTQPLAAQIRTYNSVVDSYGPGAGIAFFDEVVRVFVEHLVQLRNRVEAVRAVERARRTLRCDPHSQLDRELARLEAVAQALTSQR